MNSKAYATRATCSPKIQIYILKSAAAVLLFLQVIFWLLPPPCFLLPLLLSVSPGGVLCPAVLRLFFLILLSVTEIVPAVLLFLYLFQLCSIQYQDFQLTGSGSRGAFH